MSNTDETREKRRAYARERARRLRQDPEYRKLELERNTRWRKDNPHKNKESRSKSHRKWYLEHKDKKLADNKKWKIENPERVNEMAREERQRNPIRRREIGVTSQRKRRAQKKGSMIGPFVGEYESILRNDPCAYCGDPCKHVDHIDPLVKGGSHTWENMTASCSRCNQKKHAKSLLEFLCQ